MTKLSVQLFTMRSIDDDAEMLDSVKAVGFEFVELYGAKLSRGSALATLLSERGLQATGAHVALADLTDEFGAVVENAQAFNISSLFVPSVPVPQRAMPAEGWRELGKKLALLSDKLSAYGMTLGYHNHNWDLHLKDGDKTALDLVFEAAGSAPVQWEADIAWLTRGGVDPIVWLKRHSSRLAAAHVKDLAPQGQNEEEAGWADVGAGVLDWKVLWPEAVANGAKVMVVEHDKPLNPTATIANSFRYLQENLR
ncbi:sugar phosphate isomerase/epimerase family protein [Rhizobium leguminosarum]|uniref:sugar phosphate isomerase/epimerase family protein n=1 Tax=Rhizobium leguminosarum TaxID=384 RepID=UPI001CDC8FBC|nr:sugar phosphate isomerase/epimerase [Rhizobium leguminosarum]MCA2411283.1 sugar phosphate isomerase/epimerase [Rhizobium leguminosarum]